MINHNEKQTSVTITGDNQSQQKEVVKIPTTVKVNGKKVKVTSIKANAFKNNKKIKEIVIGKNIKTIGQGAFDGCKNLKKITIYSTSLTSKSFGKNSFRGLNKKVVITVPKKKFKNYKKWLKKAGVKGKKQKIKKMK